MYRDEHLPPHVQAIYHEYAAQISIRPPGVIQGKLPPRVLGYAIPWASLHQDELAQCREAARTDQPIGKIEPWI